MSAKSGSLSIVCVQSGPQKMSVIWNSGVSAIQGLLKYWSEWKDSRDFQNCPLSEVPLYYLLVINEEILTSSPYKLCTCKLSAALSWNVAMCMGFHTSSSRYSCRHSS